MPRGSERLSFDDAQILRLESEAIKGHTGKVAVFGPKDGGGLDANGIRARVAERIGELPRLTQRVDLERRRPSWVDVPDPDLGWHVNAAHGGSGELSRDGFRLLAGELMSERLDHSRPLWRFDIASLEGGRTGLVARIHHAMADGVSAIRIISTLLWDPSDPGGETGSGHPKPAPTPERRRRGSLRSLPGTLRRELRPGSETVFDRHIGPRRELAWRSFPLQRLKGIEHGAGEGVTVNDVVLAVVAGAIASWRGEGHHPASLKAQVPVSLHSRTESAGQLGNRDSFLNVELPLDEPDCAARLRQISAETEERKQDHDAETMYSFFHALGRFRPLYKGVTRLTSGPREFALSISNVPGPRERPLLLGHDVAEFSSFAEPADRHALRVSVVSLGGDLAFGLCADPEAVSGLERLAEALEESVDELDAAAG